MELASRLLPDFGTTSMSLVLECGIFVLGVGIGALLTAAVQIRQIRRLHKILVRNEWSPRGDKAGRRSKASPSNPQTLSAEITAGAEITAIDNSKGISDKVDGTRPAAAAPKFR